MPGEFARLNAVAILASVALCVGLCRSPVQILPRSP
jgi:hypothetical protein